MFLTQSSERLAYWRILVGALAWAFNGAIRCNGRRWAHVAVAHLFDGYGVSSSDGEAAACLIRQDLNSQMATSCRRNPQARWN